ncbi:MAG: intradiol ring-cleavage dioxygenase [Bdellovibrionota bacterium]
MSEHDDRPIGKVLSRREAILLLGSAAVLAFEAGLSRSAFAAASKAPCIIRPEQTEGPYFVDERLERSDIRSDPGTGLVCPGVPLELVIGVQQITNYKAPSCIPLVGATVDVWHCDADGVYSDEVDEDFNSRGKKFLRGFQRTGTDGQVTFKTIYPGWYVGRTVHIHTKIRVPSTQGAGRQFSEFTSQMYFDDAMTDAIFRLPPYSKRGERNYRNATDVVFADGGTSLMASLTKTTEGYRAAIDYALAPVNMS